MAVEPDKLVIGRIYFIAVGSGGKTPYPIIRTVKYEGVKTGDPERPNRYVFTFFFTMANLGKVSQPSFGREFHLNGLAHVYEYDELIYALALISTRLYEDIKKDEIVNVASLPIKGIPETGNPEDNKNP